MATLALTTILALALAVLTHGWPLASPKARHQLAIAMNLGAIVALVAALRAEGLRESAMTSYVLMGATYRTAIASAAASYYYYVLTATCLGLGFVGVAFAEPVARFISARPVLYAGAIAWLVTLVRFLLEKSAAPSFLALAVGVTWIAPIAGAYLALTLPAGECYWRRLSRRLLVYAFLVRGAVALLGVVATSLRLGTHYDVSGVTTVALGAAGPAYSFVPGSLEQMIAVTLVPQLVGWTAFTIAAGTVGALVVARLLPGRTGRRADLPSPALSGE